MAKIVFFSPREEMLEQARRVMERLDMTDVELRLVSSSNAVNQARKAAEAALKSVLHAATMLR